MAKDAESPRGSIMVILTAEEVEEMRLAMAARARANGSGTKPHEVCKSILRKLTEAEPMPLAMKTNAASERREE